MVDRWIHKWTVAEAGHRERWVGRGGVREGGADGQGVGQVGG